MTKLVGILNITPDSFSDGGQFLAAGPAVAQYEALVRDGADMVDIGAESTRPGATPITAEEEWARLGPVLAAITPTIPISIDTRHAQTAEKALGYGVAVINDVGGLQDLDMRRVLRGADCRVIVMHALSIPARRDVMWPADIDPIAEILRWKQQVTDLAAASGIDPARLIYDPGLGFGKSAEQSMFHVKHAETLVKSGGNWLYGHSRKSFLGGDMAARDAATLDCSRQLIAAGVQYLRVHDVKGHRALCCM